MRYTTATIRLSPKQAELIEAVVSRSPWFQRKAKKCRVILLGEGTGTLEFQLETNSAEPDEQDSDYRKLMDGMLTCRTFGWSKTTSEQIRTKLRRAVERLVTEAKAA